MDGAVGWAVELLAFVWLRRGYLHTVVPLLDVEGFSAPKTTKIKQFKKNVLMDVLKTLSYNIYQIPRWRFPTVFIPYYQSWNTK